MKAQKKINTCEFLTPLENLVGKLIAIFFYFICIEQSLAVHYNPIWKECLPILGQLRSIMINDCNTCLYFCPIFT